MTRECNRTPFPRHVLLMLLVRLRAQCREVDFHRRHPSEVVGDVVPLGVFAVPRAEAVDRAYEANVLQGLAELVQVEVRENHLRTNGCPMALAQRMPKKLGACRKARPGPAARGPAGPGAPGRG